ncbi:MAG: 30S ribosome-binding factor RbfA [Gammaproteobacteria bacterium]
MKPYGRTERIAHSIERELAQLIQQEIDDPRFPTLVTISEVVVSANFSHARVYVTVLDDENQIPIMLEILNKAARYLRTCLAKRLKLRTTPQLRFVYDATLARANRLTTLIDNVAPEEDGQDEQDLENLQE